MEPKSNLPAVQSVENYRDILTPNFVPWLGQARCYALIAESTKVNHVFILPTGYGKTETALGCYAIARARGIVDRILIIVANDLQRSQLGQEAKKKVESLGFEVTGVAPVESKIASVFRSNTRREVEIFIVTYQQLAFNIAWFEELLSIGEWMVVRDEVHHCAEERTWGTASNAVCSYPSVKVVLNMSATPIRTDRRQLKGVEYDDLEDGSVKVRADVEVTLVDAINEGACRRPIAKIHHYFVDVMIGEDGTTKRVSTETLKEEGVSDFSSYEAKFALRYCTSYISTMLSDAVAELSSRNLRHPHKHQMMVWAMTQKHAESVAKILNDIAGIGFCDWIGMNRDDEQNRRILDRFTGVRRQANGDPIPIPDTDRLRCLVQVNKAGEGYNNPYVSVGVFLDLVQSVQKKSQDLGRLLRRNRCIPKNEDTASVLASADSSVGQMIEQLDLDLAASKREKKDQTGTREGDLPQIPDVHVLDATWDRTDVVTPSGVIAPASDEADLRKWAASAGLVGVDHVPVSVLRKLYESARGVTPSAEKPNEFSNETTARDFWKSKIESALSVIAGVAIRLSFGTKSVNKQTAGAIKRNAHAQWKRRGVGGNGDMTSSQLREKYQWLQNVNADMVESKRAPEWLMP